MKTMSRTKNRWLGSAARLQLVGVACVAALLPSVIIPAGASAHGRLPAAVPPFVGAPAVPRPVVAPAVPHHPFMAPNGRSNLHDDAYMSDTYVTSGPLGRRLLRITVVRPHLERTAGEPHHVLMHRRYLFLT